MELRDWTHTTTSVRAAIKRTTFSLLERHWDGIPTLCLRDLELVSSSTSHCKEDYAPKRKESKSGLHANCPWFKAEISLLANPEHHTGGDLSVLGSIDLSSM